MAKVSKFVSVPLYVVLALVICVSILLLVVGYVAPPVAISYLEKHDKEIIGRSMSIGDIDLNMFRGKLTIKDAVLYEADDTTTFVSFDELFVDMSLHKLLTKTVYVDSIRLAGLYAEALQKGKEFNFTDIIDRFSADSTAVKDTTPISWSVVLNDILIDKSTIHYEDQLVGSEFTLEDFSLQIPTINVFDIDSDMGLHFDFDKGGSLDTKVLLDMNKGSYTLWVDLNRFRMNSLLPYVKQYLYVSDFDGYVTTRMNIKGSIEHIMDINVGGTCGLKGVELYDLQGKKFLSADTCEVEIGDLKLENYYVGLNDLYISGVEVDFDRTTDSTNTITTVVGDKLVEDEELVEEAEEIIEEDPWILAAKRIKIENINARFVDHSLDQPFTLNLSSMSVNSTNFDTRKRCAATISAHIQGKGTLMANWDGMVDGSLNHKVYLRLSNLGLESFSPYTVQYTSYPFVGGSLSFETNTNIVDGNIKSDNNLLIYHPNVGPKDNSVKAEYDIPIKTCLYLLTDMDNKVKFHIPVTGNLNDPKFSYRKIIVRTVFNAMIKVAVSPFAAIARLAGNRSDDLHDILIDLRQTELTEDQYEKLDNIASVLEAKPGLSVTMKQHINFHNAETSWCKYFLKRDFYLSNHTEEPTSRDLEKIDVESKDVKMFLWDKLKKSDLEYTANLDKDVKTFYGSDVRDAIIRGVDIRDSLVTSYMKQIGVSDSSFHVVRMSMDSLLKSTGANKFVVTVDGLDADATKEVEKASMEINGKPIEEVK